MGARSHGLTDLQQMGVHGGGRAARQNEAGGLANFGTDRPEQIGRSGALIVRRRRPRSSFRPAPGDAVLLADARLVLPPQFDHGGAGERGFDGLHRGGETFLKSSIACSSCA